MKYFKIIILCQGNIVFADSRPMYLGRDLPRQLQFYVMNSDTNLRRLLYQSDSWMRLDLGIFRVDRESTGSGLMIPESQIGRRRSHAGDIFADQGPTVLQVPVQVEGGVAANGGLLTPPPKHLGRKFSLQY